METITNAFGQVITDYDPELAVKLERIGYGEVDGADKKRLANWMALRFSRDRSRSSLHPAIAALECAMADPSVAWSLRQRIGNPVCLWLFKRAAKSYGDIPGVNDGLMVRWYWTHDEKYLDELIVRARRMDPVGETCRWMLGSVALSHPKVKSRLSREPEWSEPTT